MLPHSAMGACSVDDAFETNATTNYEPGWF